MPKHVRRVRVPPITAAFEADIRGVYPNRAHLGAYWRGYWAAVDRAPRRTNPYTETRSTRGNMVTWALAYRRAWFHGYDDGAAGRGRA